MWKIYAETKDQIKSINEIISYSPSDFIFNAFYYFLNINSTQKFAIDLTRKKNLKESAVVISDSQFLGHGRKGGLWSSPVGGVWLSIIINKDFKLKELFEYQMITTISVCESIENETGLKTILKWPNDVFIHDKKVSGIILDSSIESKTIESIVIGIGINSNNDQNSTLQEINSKGVFHHPITTLRDEVNQPINNVKLVSSLLNRISNYISDLDKYFLTRQRIMNSYTDRIMDSMNYFKYFFTYGDKKIEGIIKTVEPDGSIMVKAVENDQNFVNTKDNSNNLFPLLIRANSSFDVDVKSTK